MSATTAGQEFVRLEVGDPAPWFHQRSPTNPNYAFDTAAGRYIVLCFFGSAAIRSGVRRSRPSSRTGAISTTQHLLLRREP